MKKSTEDVVEELSSVLSSEYQIREHDTVPGVVSIQHTDPVSRPLTAVEDESGYVVVGEMCGLSVMRGAEVFSPGILCISPPSLKPGHQVAVLADTRGQCLRGSKMFQGETRHLASGELMVDRDSVFRDNCSGVGVHITEKLFPCPSLHESQSSGSFMLLNLPSIIAVNVLGKDNSYMEQF